MRLSLTRQVHAVLGGGFKNLLFTQIKYVANNALNHQLIGVYRDSKMSLLFF
jgi:hypothetical protein